MKKDKTLSILRQFSAKEMQQFLVFLESPYFNTRSEILEFGEFLAQYHPLFPEDCVDLNNIPHTILPEAVRTKKELSYLKSRTYDLLKQFIRQEQLKAKPLLAELYTNWAIHAYAPTESIKLLNQIRARYSKLERSDTYDLLFQYLATDILHVQAPEGTLEHEMLLQESIDLLDEFYVTNKLIYGIETQNRRQFIQHTAGFDNPLMEEIEGFVSQIDQPPPRTALYLQIYLCGKHPKEARHFDKLFMLLQQNQGSIDMAECRTIYLITINLCIRRMRIDHQYYAKLCLQLYEEGIRTKILFEDGCLSEWTYKNAIKLGLQLQMTEWTEKFIYQHNEYILPESRANALYSNLAELSFVKKDFDITFDYLAKISTSDWRYYFSTKILLIKTFYETQNIDSCMSAVGSMTVYISRLKGVSTAVKKNCLHFCQVLYQLTSAKSDRKVAKVKEKLQTTTPLAERGWLMDVFRREHPRAV